jgi:hypothetical protein
LVGEEVRFVNPNHSKKGTIGRIKSVTKKGYLFQADNSRFGRWCDLSELEKFDRPVPKGFRMLSDEPRLASDGYWSLSCKDWLVIGDRVEEANRDKWKAIRFVVDEPEPVKHFVVVTDEKGDQVFYVNGVLNRSRETSYDCFMAEAAKGRAVRIENYDAEKPVREWPEKLLDLVRKNNLVFEERETIEPKPVKHPGPSAESVFGSNPIEVRPIMQIRLPVSASVLGTLGDMLEKHYPGSTMRQVGGYLVFDEPIES